MSTERQRASDQVDRTPISSTFRSRLPYVRNKRSADIGLTPLPLLIVVVRRTVNLEHEAQHDSVTRLGSRSKVRKLSSWSESRQVELFPGEY